MVKTRREEREEVGLRSIFCPTCSLGLRSLRLMLLLIWRKIQQTAYSLLRHRPSAFPNIFSFSYFSQRRRGRDFCSLQREVQDVRDRGQQWCEYVDVSGFFQKLL